MKIHPHPLLLSLAVLFVCQDGKTLSPTEHAGRRVENFNRNWKFARGAQPGAETPAFNDASWQPVRLPHAWAIAGPYQPDGDPNTGKLPWRGEGWYRKTFSLPAADRAKQVYLDRISPLHYGKPLVPFGPAHRP